MSVSVDTLYDNRNSFLVKRSSALQGGMFAAIGVGVAALAGGFAATTPERVWGAFLFNLYFFFALGLGGLALGAMQDIVGAVWGRPMRRVQEGFGAFVPYACAAFGVFLICLATNAGNATHLYSWMKDPHMLDHFWGKNVWLTKNFFIARNAVMIILIYLGYRWQIKATTARDAAFVAGDKEKAIALGKETNAKLKFWSAPLLVVYSICFTFMGFDFLMSLSPLWFSTLWGGWLFAVMMQTLMASLLITLFIMKSTSIGGYINRLQFHDTGKLLHGFTIFFAYLTYAHVLTYWYGNMPEFTEYFIHRLHGPWLYIVMIAPFFNFGIPLFALIFKAAKWTASITIPLAVIILTAQWFVYMLVVMPETGVKHLGVPWVELGGFVLFLGLFIFSFTQFSSKHPMLPVADPLLPEAYEEHH